MRGGTGRRRPALFRPLVTTAREAAAGTNGVHTKGNGRGLIIVAALAHAWGVETEPDSAGKSVWFELG